MGLFDAFTAPFTKVAEGISGFVDNLTGKTAARASEKAVKNQLEWEKQKATSAHQWEVEDLKKAGLNPILSAGGQGATAGSIGVPDYSSITSGAQGALGMLTNLLMQAPAINNTNAQTAKTISETKLNEIKAIGQQYQNGIISQDKAIKEIEAKMWNLYGNDKFLSEIAHNINNPFSLGVYKLLGMENKNPQGKPTGKKTSAKKEKSFIETFKNKFKKTILNGMKEHHWNYKFMDKLQ